MLSNYSSVFDYEIFLIFLLSLQQGNFVFSKNSCIESISTVLWFYIKIYSKLVHRFRSSYNLISDEKLFTSFI